MTKVPDVEFDMPPCPIPGCAEDLVTGYFGELRCEECLMEWGADGQNGGLIDLDVPRCGAVGEGVSLRFARRIVDEPVRRVCYLPADHDEYGRPHAGYDPDDAVGEWNDWDVEDKA